MNRSVRTLADSYRAITDNIFVFCDALRFKPTWQQRQLLEAVQLAAMGKGSNWIAAKSGQGPGKTTASVILGLWRALRAEDALTIVTAPTMRQCTDVWLAEARRRLKHADKWLQNIINITKTKIEIGGRPDWGVKLVTATREENAQGYHEENMTVIAEEASGIPRDMITQFKGTLSNPNALFVQIGNPNSRDCDFFDCFYGHNAKRWVKLTFNAEETARDYPHIVNPQRNQDLEDEFGRDSDVYRIRVLGEFPHTEPNCVISGDDLHACTAHDLLLPCARMSRGEMFGGGIARQFGLDFARYGGDESTVFRRHGNAIVEWTKFVRRDPHDAIHRAFAMQAMADWSDQETIYVADAGGMGQGLMYNFHNANKQVVEFHNGSASIDRQYDNKITEAWFQLAKRLRSRSAYMPLDSLLSKQLTTRRYYTTAKGRLVLESKDEYIKRGFDSPDRADGCVLAFWDRVQAIGNLYHRGAA